MLAVTSCVAVAQQGSSGYTSWLPAWGQLAQARQQTEIPAQVTTINKPVATFIVRFDNEPVLNEIGKTFRRDGAGARAKFATWCEDYPDLQDLALVRASYSGELILALPQNDPKNRSPRDVLNALQGMDNLAYAEIDEIAHPGAED